MEAYIFDIALVIIAIVIVVLTAKRGFVLSLLSTVSLGVSAFLSYKFTKPVSEFIYSSFLYDKILEKVTEAVASLSDSITDTEKLAALVELLPVNFLKIAQGFGFNLDTALSSVDLSQLANDKIITAFVDNIAFDFVMSMLEVIVFIVLFAALSVVLRCIALLFNKIVKKLPIVGKTNTILGGALGVIKAVIAISVICLVVCPILFAIDMPWLENVISQSHVYQFIIENNPINNWM